MAQWYCVMTSTKPYGGYDSNEAVSFGSVLPPKTHLQEKGLVSIALGDFGKTGPDFTRFRFDIKLQALVPAV